MSARLFAGSSLFDLNRFSSIGTWCSRTNYFGAGASISVAGWWEMNFGQRRRMATLPPAARHQKPVRVVIPTAGVLFDPYEPFKPTPALFSLERVRHWWAQMKSNAKSGFAMGRMGRILVPKLNAEVFMSQARDDYIAINTAFLRGDITTLRSLVTEEKYAELKSKLRHRDKTHLHEWEFAGFEKGTMIVHSRMKAVAVKDNFFGQITVRFCSRQGHRVTDGKGKEVMNTNGVVPVDEFWVFERPINNKPSSRWRFAYKLDAPANTSTQPGALPSTS